MCASVLGGIQRGNRSTFVARLDVRCGLRRKITMAKVKPNRLLKYLEETVTLDDFYDQHNIEELNKFLESIQHRIPFYRYRIVSYLLLKDLETPRIALSRVFYDYLPPNRNAEFKFESQSLEAGIFIEEVSEQTDPKHFLAKPVLRINNTIAPIKIIPTDHARVYRRVNDPDPLQNYLSQTSIEISCDGDDRNTLSRLQTLELKKELKTHATPYNDINELLSRVGLNNLLQSNGDPVIEVVAGQVLHIIKFPAFNDEGCQLSLMAPAQMDISAIRLGFRVIGKNVDRGVAVINKVRDLPQEGAIELAAHIKSDDAAYIQLFVSVNGDLMHQLWSVNPSKSLNLLAAVYRHIDNDLDVLKRLLSEPGNKSRDFERGIAYLLEQLGFHAFHFGGFDPFEKTVDLIAITPQRRLLLIECSTDIESAQGKLAKLANRASKIQEWLDGIGMRPESLQCVFVTTKAKHELVGDVAYAAEHKIAMIYREDIREVVEGINAPQNPEEIFSRVVRMTPPQATPGLPLADPLGI